MMRNLLPPLLILSLCFCQAAWSEQPASSTVAQSSTAAPTKKPRVVTVLAGFDLVDKDALKKQAMAAGASRGNGAVPVALAPHLGKVYGTTPEFCWNEPSGGGDYMLTVWDDAQNVVFRTQVKGYRHRYPATAPKLVHGKTYFWTVESPPSMSGSQQSVPVGFEVISGDQRVEVEHKLAAVSSGDDYAQELAKAKIYTDARLWYDAISAYTDLMQKYPARAELYEARGTLFAQLPVTQADADQDFNQADHLRTRP